MAFCEGSVPRSPIPPVVCPGLAQFRTRLSFSFTRFEL